MPVVSLIDLVRSANQEGMQRTSSGGMSINRAILERITGDQFLVPRAPPELVSHWSEYDRCDFSAHQT